METIYVALIFGAILAGIFFWFSRELNATRDFYERAMDRLLAKTIHEFKAYRPESEKTEEVPPKNDFDEWLVNLERRGFGSDELAKIKETSPADIHE